MNILQNWGNYADMGQAVAIYTTYTVDVLLICWFGTQLTQHVRAISYFILNTLRIQFRVASTKWLIRHTLNSQ